MRANLGMDKNGVKESWFAPKDNIMEIGVWTIKTEKV